MTIFRHRPLTLGLSGLLLAAASSAQADALSIRFSEVPLAQTASAHASFAFSAAAATGFECALNDGDFAQCQSPHTVFGLDTGAHRLAVRANGADGASGPAAVVTWEQLDPFTASHPDLARTQQQPSPVAPNSWRGILRINCDFSHAAYEDPIVFPNQALKAHLHKFYGLLNAGPTTSIAGLFRTPEDSDGRVSSCQGNDLNRSSYWVPALLAPLYDERGVRQVDVNGDPAFDVVHAVVGNDDVAHEVFYYSAGVDDLQSIQPIPTGLVMIAGDMRATPEAPQSASIVRWHCQSWESSDASNPRFSATIPECVEPDRLRADLFFPSCWNGVDLDSSDHKSHLAYPVTENNRAVCPSSHPVPIVRVSYHYAYPVKPEHSDPATRSSRGWQLSSDMYASSVSRPGGSSLHGDWMNGWHPELMREILEGCIQGALDCHDGNLGNGYRLGGTSVGHGEVPDIIFEGMGPAHTDLPSLSIADVVIAASATGVGVARFELVLSQPLAQALTVRVSTQNITAVAGSDYLPLDDVAVEIPAGSTVIPLEVIVLPQLLAARKQFAVEVDAGNAVLVADPYAVAEINGFIAASVLPTLSMQGNSVPEGDSGTSELPFLLTLSRPAGSGGVSVQVSTVRVTGIGGIATPGLDYTPLIRKQVLIPEGDTQATVIVKVRGDRIPELDEAVTLQIDTLDGATALDSLATGYIIDDDSMSIMRVDGPANPSDLQRSDQQRRANPLEKSAAPGIDARTR